MYLVIKAFYDLADGMHHYKVGDAYPRQGRANAQRVAVLMSDKNNAGQPLIEYVKTPRKHAKGQTAPE